MDLDATLWVGTAGLIAAFIGSIGGFSLAVAMTPVMMAVVPIETAVVLVALVHLPANVLSLIRHRHGWQGGVFPALAFPLLLVTGISAFGVGRVPSALLMLILGLYLSAYAAFGLFEEVRKFLSRRELPLPVVASGAGLFAGTTGVGDALRDHVLQSRLAPESALRMGALIAVLTDLLRLGIYLVNDAGDLWSAGAPVEVAGAILGAALLGVLLGKALKPRWQDRDLNRLLRWPLLIVGIYFVEKGIRSLFG